MLRRVLAISIPLLFWSGCQTAPKSYDGVREGQWRAKAVIHDLQESHSYVVTLDLNLVRDQRARMDVLTGFGTGVASMVVSPGEVRYLLVNDKKFYSGAPQAGVMKPILAIPFDPRWLNNILFEEPITDADWKCSRDSAGLLATCESSALGLKITWSDRHGDKKTILLEHAAATVQIKVQSFRPKVEERKNLFVLEAPEGYKKLHVR